MVGVAAGMCHEGMMPVIISYAPFATGRIFDQIKANAGAMGLPIGIIGSAAGLSKGDLGPLLMCVDDIAMLRTIPDMFILTPADGIEIVRSIGAALATKKPFYIRLTGGRTLPPVHEAEFHFEIGKALELRSGSRVLLITSGAVTAQALRAADMLAEEGQKVAVLEMHTLKPLDIEAIDRYWGFDAFVTVEEHSIYGGLGSAVAEYLAQKGGGPVLKCLGTQDCYFGADLYENLLEKAGLSAKQLYRTIKALL